jgi:hypothetical protein
MLELPPLELVMSQSPQNDARTLELAKIVGTEQDLSLLQEHLKEIIEGAAFKGSHRSGQFLKYIVDQAIAGHFESLKERVIGVELFGRAPTYDTGDDAIVRVTASDVRKRLLQHYGRYGAASEFRITLSPGSYIPEIIRDSPPESITSRQEILSIERAVEKTDAAAETTPLETSVPKDTVISSTLIASESLTSHADAQKKPPLLKYWPFLLLFTIVNAGIWGFFWLRLAPKSSSAAAVLPWSVLLNSPRSLQLITSDPDIAQIQDITHQTISISDYANHRYVLDPGKLTPQEEALYQVVVQENKGSIVDEPIAVSITELTAANAKKIDLHPARTIQLSNLQTDDNYIVLGSPRSNPWSTYFSDPLSFRFQYDAASGQEIVRNFHPRHNEQTQYVPTGLGGSTGQSYAVIAFVKNPEQNGHALLLAGANAEGTNAAAKLVTDPVRLGAVLKNCGIAPSGPLQHFELLLRLNMMAGSPTRFNVEACHILPASPTETNTAAADQ